MAAARTGNPYTIALRKESIPIPKRFYCHWILPGDVVQYDNKGKILKDDPQGRCCFNHRVDLPTRKWETDRARVEVIPVELTHFNLRMMMNYFRHRKYSQNKCRGSGASEILTIRYMIFKYGVMTTVKNRKCIVLPGTSSKQYNNFIHLPTPPAFSHNSTIKSLMLATRAMTTIKASPPFGSLFTIGNITPSRT